MDYGMKTMQRYLELNLKIQSFKLQNNSTDMISVAKEWTMKATNLGATHMDIKGSNFSFFLPHEVLQSESLVRLSLVCGKIDLQDVNCPRLKSLRLGRVRLQGNILRDILSVCPLMEELLLSRCYSAIHSYYKLKVSLVFIGGNSFHKLKVLSLEFMDISEWLFRDLPSKFPCLKELTLKYCTGYKKIQICSNSLECIVLFHSGMLRVDFDFLRIRKFKFESPSVPSLSLKTTSRELETDISFTCTVKSSWFVKFRELLLELSSFRINLRLEIATSPIYVKHMIDLPIPPIVEKLEFLMDAPISVQSVLLDDLFWSCRPKFIILPCSPKHVKNYEVIKLICNKLVGEEYENRNMSALHDLEEIKVEVSGRTAWTWSRPLPSKTLDVSGSIETKVSLGSLFIRTIDASAFWGWKDETKICLHLKWG